MDECYGEIIMERAFGVKRPIELAGTHFCRARLKVLNGAVKHG